MLICIQILKVKNKTSTNNRKELGEVTGRNPNQTVSKSVVWFLEEIESNGFCKGFYIIGYAYI
jgi:hypothetical protein